jgi:hypothetical protein
MVIGRAVVFVRHPGEGGILILLSHVASLLLTATCNRWFML